MSITIYTHIKILVCVVWVIEELGSKIQECLKTSIIRIIVQFMGCKHKCIECLYHITKGL